VDQPDVLSFPDAQTLQLAQQKGWELMDRGRITMLNILAKARLRLAQGGHETTPNSDVIW